MTSAARAHERQGGHEPHDQVVVRLMSALEQLNAETEDEAEGLAEHVRRVVDDAPPLSPRQREKLAAALGRGGGTT